MQAGGSFTPNLDGKLEKYAGPSDVESYVELVHNMMRVKMAAATITVEQVESLAVERAAAKALLEEKEGKVTSRVPGEVRGTSEKISREDKTLKVFRECM